MSHKTFLKITGALFAVIGALHVLRLLLGWEAVIGGWDVPRWMSWLAAALAGYLGYTAFTLAKKK